VKLNLKRLMVGIALSLQLTAHGAAQPAFPTETGSDAGAMRPDYTNIDSAQQPVVPTQYAEPSYADTPQFGEPTVIVPPAAPLGCDVCGEMGGCQCDALPYRSGWTLGFELYGMRSHLTDGAFGRWPDDGGGAARITLGYEWQSGFGIRAHSWGFGQDARLPGDDVELAMGTFQLDFYKAIVSPYGELIFGAGPAGGALEFRIPDEGAKTEFLGGGATAFVEGYYPFYRQPTWEIAFVGQTRLTLLTGEWRDNGGQIVDDTNGDSMSVWEVGFGLEYRHSFGRCDDHFWFVQVMPEYQHWSSEWMGDALGSSVALTGTNVRFGLTW
jgi:hypothetical protein